MKVTDEVALVLRGARMQRCVIGALIIRELHSHFGRILRNLHIEIAKRSDTASGFQMLPKR
jgi:hypothetical protein